MTERDGRLEIGPAPETLADLPRLLTLDLRAERTYRLMGADDEVLT